MASRPILPLLLLLFFAFFLIYPVGHILAGAFIVDGRLSLEAFRLAFSSEVIVASIQNSFMVATVVTILSSLIAVPLAHLFARYEFRGQRLLQGALLAALVLPPFVSAVGIRQLFARFGSVNLALLEFGVVSEPIDFLGAHPLAGVIGMETFHLYPILFLYLVAALRNVDPSLLEAAEGAGAGRLTRLVRITLPLALPGYFAGTIIVFIFALTDLGTPIVFGATELVPVQIFDRAMGANRGPVAYAMVLILLLISSLLFLGGRRMVARGETSQATKGSVAAPPRAIRTAWWPLILAGLVLLALLTLLPHFAILTVAFSERWFFTIFPEQFSLGHFQQVLTDETAYLGVRNSLVYAGCSTLLDLLLGLAIAWIAVRGRGRIGALLDSCAMLPLALPGVVLAFSYAGCFSGTMLDPRRDPFMLIVLGYAVRRLPYMVRAADAGLRQVPVAFEEAARNLGASGLRTFRRITLPLLAGSLLAGCLLAFSFAMLEVSESLILATSKQDYPIAKAIYVLLGDLSSGPQVASAMGVLGAGLLVYSLLVAGRILGKGLGRLFRA
ncbi:MAG: iron ABC transporter permease [Planctomycetota bacterium]